MLNPAIANEKIVIQIWKDKAVAYTICKHCDREIIIPQKLQGQLARLSGEGVKQHMYNIVMEHLYNVHYAVGRDIISTLRQQRYGICPNQTVIEMDKEKDFIEHGAALSDEFKQRKEAEYQLQKKALEAQGVVANA